MNKRVNKFLLAGDKFMYIKHLRWLVDHLQKKKEEYKKLKKQRFIIYLSK